MRRGCFVIASLAVLSATVARSPAQAAIPALFTHEPRPVVPSMDCIFDVSSLPTLGGKVARLLPGTNGDVVGAILTSGVELVMPPGLAALTRGLRPGATLSVRGLWSASRQLVRAFALAGTPPVCAAPMPELLAPAIPLSAQGVVLRPLHDGDGAVNGALLNDGTVLRVPAAGASADELAPGHAIYVSGAGYRTAYGLLIRVDTLGPTRAQAVRVSDAAAFPKGAAAGSPAYDEIGAQPGGVD